jgi:hypothetical protein
MVLSLCRQSNDVRDARPLTIPRGACMVPGVACSDVDAFVRALPTGWQQRCCLEMLEDLRALPAPLDESLKWRNPHFDRGGAILKWYVAKEWINVYFYRGALLEDRRGCFEATDNTRMRTIKVSEQRPLDRDAFRDLLGQAVALDAGNSSRTRTS